MEQNFISIIIPMHNAEKTIKETIFSIYNQTYENWELLVVDDSSTDNSVKIIEKIKTDKRVRLLKNQTQKGVAFSRNIGVKNAQGEWIAFIDSDDLWEKKKLETQIDFYLKNKKSNFIFTASNFIDNQGRQLNAVLNVPNVIRYKKLLMQNVIPCSSVLIKRTLFVKNFMPESYVSIHEDYAAWLSILKSGVIAYGINEPLLRYRLTENSKSRNKFKSAKMNWNTYKYVGISLPKRILLMFLYMVKGFNKYMYIFIKGSKK